MNNHLLKKDLKGYNTNYDDHCVVPWRIKGSYACFYAFIIKISQFMKVEGHCIASLSDRNWLCNLALIVDISKYLTSLNVLLHGSD